MKSGLQPRGDRIRDLRLARGMTQEKLARMSNVDIKTIYRAERGEAGMRPETLLDIATALEVPLDEIREALASGVDVDDAGADPRECESEGHGNLVLRRVDRASSFYQLASSCEHYSWSFHVDPDEATAAAMREWMQIVKRAVEGPERVPDDFDRQGEFSEPARVARLKSLVEELRDAGITVLANKFIHVVRQDEHGRSAAVVVLRVVFVEGRVERRKEFVDFALPREVAPKEVLTISGNESKVIEGVGGLDFRTRGNSVMGALELALATIGDPTPYDVLMGASGIAFRMQMALPEWCPSAPYASVGFDCVPQVAEAIGRTIEWIPVEPSAPNPMQRRVRAIVESIDRGVPVLYAAEECGLIVGYHHGGEQFSLRTYFDETELYSVLERLDWPSPGILGEKKDRPAREATLRRSLDVAVDLAGSNERFPTHHLDRYYAGGFTAWEAWIEGLRDESRYQGKEAPELAAPIQANAWCYTSLVDARSAASRYLAGLVDIEPRLEEAGKLYAEMVSGLEGSRKIVPEPRFGSNDGVTVAYRMRASDAWPAESRHAQADALERALGLERQAVEVLAGC